MASPCNTPIRGYIYSIIYLNILHATFPRLIPRGIALFDLRFPSFHYIQTSAFFASHPFLDFTSHAFFWILLIPSLSWEPWTSDACYHSAFYSLEHLNLLLAYFFPSCWGISHDFEGGYIEV